jgi:hypothetical protein
MSGQLLALNCHLAAHLGRELRELPMADDGFNLADRHFIVAAILTAPRLDSGDGPEGAVAKFNQTLAELGKSGSYDLWTEARKQVHAAAKKR